MAVTGKLAGLAISSMALWTVGCASHPPVVTNGGSPPGLRVSGSGEAEGAPDVALISLGVEARHADSRQASAMVAERMANVIAALKQVGVAEDDIQTSNLSMYFERAPKPEPRPLPLPAEGGGEATVAPKPAPTVEGVYRVTNTVRATLRDLDRASQVVAAATSAGANQVHGIRFELDDDDALVAEARAAAVADAKRNAEQLAELMGVRLGRVISVQEGGGGGPVAPMMMRAESADGGGMPVQRGTLTVQRSVEVLYALP
ncbi:MAG: SIMPL domain-containing protein [Myxococcales bacterium]|jgi:uncharacterized protein YggE